MIKVEQNFTSVLKLNSDEQSKSLIQSKFKLHNVV